MICINEVKIVRRYANASKPTCYVHMRGLLNIVGDDRSRVLSENELAVDQTKEALLRLFGEQPSDYVFAVGRFLEGRLKENRIAGYGLVIGLRMREM